MPYLIPPCKPLTEEQVEHAFDYVLALQTGDGGAVAGRADADPALVIQCCQANHQVDPRCCSLTFAQARRMGPPLAARRWVGVGRG